MIEGGEGLEDSVELKVVHDRGWGGATETWKDCSGIPMYTLFITPHGLGAFPQVQTLQIID